MVWYNFYMQVPFKVDRCSDKTLTAQVVEGLKSAIDRGAYAKGSVLPPRDKMAKTLGVSECVVRAAVKQLNVEGLVTSRPRVGCVVHARRPCGSFASILIVQGGPIGSYAADVGNQILLQNLFNAGYRPTVVTFGGAGTSDMRMVRQAFRAKPDFAVLRATAESFRMVEPFAKRAGCPYIVEGGQAFKAKGAAVIPSLSYDQALERFVLECRRSRIHSAGIVYFGRPPLLNVVPMLESVGVFVEGLHVDVVSADGLEAVQRRGAQTLVRRMARGPLPELLFFADDYLTTGALPVLLEKGVRIPEDVRIVTLANKGLGPVYTKTFARIEFDAVAGGVYLSQQVLGWLRNRMFPVGGHPPHPSYQPGETFPSAGIG